VVWPAIFRHCAPRAGWSGAPIGGRLVLDLRIEGGNLPNGTAVKPMCAAGSMAWQAEQEAAHRGRRLLRSRQRSFGRLLQHIEL
jgi:hypothetical protein